tara:strand:+ start:203 stop:871 length:669 start_codon:yes stop_codon:yes gene_type:complete
MKQEFNWGPTIDGGEYLSNEIFTLQCYESIYPVKKGDVVLDLGASVGPFTWSIMDKASKVYAVEPMEDLQSTLEKNTKGYPVTIIQKALSYKNGEIDFNDVCINKFESKIVKTIDFQTLLKDNNINKIDFLKTDCEGGEYNLFTEANMHFLLNNVRNIVGEFHLSSDFPELKVEFRYFRDKYLKQFKHFEVRSLDGVDIKWDLWNDHFIDYYNMVLIYINNE